MNMMWYSPPPEGILSELQGVTMTVKIRITVHKKEGDSTAHNILFTRRLKFLFL